MEGRRIYVMHPSYYTDELCHYRVGGEINGRRLYQYPDGSLTPLGRIHYGVGAARQRIKDHLNRTQNEDGTLTLRGKIKYRTNDKYKLMSDEDLKKRANRLQLQKNVEDLQKQTSASYRLKSKLEGVAEDAIVSGSKKAVKKVLNHVIDKKLGDLLNTDGDAIAKARKSIEGKTKKEIDAIVNKMNSEKSYVELATGKKIPSGYKFMGLTEKEKEGLNKSSENQQNNKSNKNKEKQESPSKSEETKPSEKKPEEVKVPEEKKASETESSEKKSEENKVLENKKEEKKPSEKQSQTQTKSGATVTVKRDASSEKKTESNQPKEKTVDAGDIARMKAMKRSNIPIESIAKTMKLSPSTVEKYLKG